MSIVDVNGIKPFERNRQTLSAGDGAEALDGANQLWQRDKLRGQFQLSALLIEKGR